MTFTLLKEFIASQIFINEFVVPMGFSLDAWKAYKTKHNISNKEFHDENPDRKWKVVHGHKRGEVGKALPGLNKISYNKATKAHSAIVMNEADDKYMILYHIGNKPAQPESRLSTTFDYDAWDAYTSKSKNIASFPSARRARRQKKGKQKWRLDDDPLAKKFRILIGPWERPWLKEPIDSGVFLTPDPKLVAMMHGIRGKRVYAYKVPQWVVKQAGGIHRYDNAPEIIISKELWDRAKSEIKLIDSKDFKDLKVNQSSRWNVQPDFESSWLKKELENEPQAKKDKKKARKWLTLATAPSPEHAISLMSQDQKDDLLSSIKLWRKMPIRKEYQQLTNADRIEALLKNKQKIDETLFKLETFTRKLVVEMTMPNDEQIKTALDLLKKIVNSSSKFKSHVFLAGGAVRDQVMGKSPKDLDIVIDLPNGGIEFAEFLAKKIGNYKVGSNPVIYPTFGTAKVDFHGVKYNGVDLTGIDVEAVVTRSEEYTAGSRKPETRFGTIEQDVMRRDLTINSMLQDLTTGKILDLTGKGKIDLENGVIRTPSDPNKILQEDPLRILRALRFTSRYAYKLDQELFNALKKNAKELNKISKERIRDEFEKMLAGNNPNHALELIHDIGVMKYILPSLANKPNLEVVDGFEFIENLVILLRDIDINVVQSELRVLKMSNIDIQIITTLLKAVNELHYDINKSTILRVGSLLDKYRALDYIRVIYQLIPGIKSKINALPDFGEQPTIFFGGDELMSKFGVAQGPDIGRLKDYQAKLWFNDPSIKKSTVEKFLKSQL